MRGRAKNKHMDRSEDRKRHDSLRLLQAGRTLVQVRGHPEEHSNLRIASAAGGSAGQRRGRGVGRMRSQSLVFPFCYQELVKA